MLRIAATRYRVCGTFALLSATGRYRAPWQATRPAPAAWRSLQQNRKLQPGRNATTDAVFPGSKQQLPAPATRAPEGRRPRLPKARFHIAPGKREGGW